MEDAFFSPHLSDETSNNTIDPKICSIVLSRANKEAFRYQAAVPYALSPTVKPDVEPCRGCYSETHRVSIGTPYDFIHIEIWQTVKAVMTPMLLVFLALVASLESL
jgi:hypothetical protein